MTTPAAGSVKASAAATGCVKYRSPDKKTIIIYLAVFLVVVALLLGVFGGTGWLRTARLLMLYAGVFLVTIYLVRRARR